MDVDLEYVLYFSIIDENNSPYLKDNINSFAINPATVNPSNANFTEGNRKPSINGYMFGNLPAINMTQGQHVRFCILEFTIWGISLTSQDVATLGSSMDIHTPTWASHTLVDGTSRTASTMLLAGASNALDMTATVPGKWNILCHVTDRIKI